MSKKRKGGLDWFAYKDNPVSTFGMVTEDLLKSEGFKGLSIGARCMYQLLLVERMTKEERQNLYKTLEEYDNKNIIDLSEVDRKYYTDYKQGILPSDLFVFPARRALRYGYTPQNANKLLHELIAKGFVKRPFGEPKSRMQSIYAFSDKWKKDKNANQQ